MLGTIAATNSNTAQITTQRRGYSLEILAHQYSISVAFLRKLVREKKVRATRLGSRVIILHEDWEEFLKNENRSEGEKV